MKRLGRCFRNTRNLAGLAILVLTVYQLLRIVGYINVYGGIEHDGGWALGVSRYFAERGTYTSMVSTIADPTVLGDVSVDEQYEIQEPDGSIWFRQPEVAGTSIVFDGLVIKLFGHGYGALVAGPLVFYCLFLVVAALLLYRVSGLLSVLIFHGFIFCFPQLSIFLSYQALREVPGMAMVLTSLLLFTLALTRTRQAKLYMFVAGLAAGLAFNAKLITLFSLAGMFVWAFGLLIWGKPRLKMSEVWPLGVGFVLVPLFWEVVQWIVLTRVAGYESYLLRMQTRFGFVLDYGSGLRERAYSGTDFVLAKVGVLNNISRPELAAIFFTYLILALGGLAAMRLVRHRTGLATFGVLWIAWLVNTAWFIGMAKVNWPRHYWFGLIEAIMLLSAMPVVFWRWSTRQSCDQGVVTDSRRRDLWAPWTRPSTALSAGSAVVLLALTAFSFASQPYVWHVWLPDEIVPYWQNKQLTAKYGNFMPWIVIPRAEQQAAVDYIQNMPSAANVYYPAALKGAELPPLTGRMHYPLNRRGLRGNPEHPADVVVIASSMISPWHHEPGTRQGVLDLAHQVCPEPVLRNDYYIICRVDDVRFVP